MTEASGLTPFQAPQQQRVFRHLLQAFSYPGRVVRLPDGAEALTQVLAALLDAEATLADPDGLLDARVRALLGATAAAPQQAQFVLACADAAPRLTPSLGTLESPELGATLVLRVGRIGSGRLLSVSGPGVDGHQQLRLDGLNPAWLAARAQWNAHFPLGVDLIVVDAQQVVALPRTTRIATEGEF